MHKISLANSVAMESSRRLHRVSWHQLEVLWDFLNSNRTIATGHNRSLQAKEYSQRKWREIAEILNSQGDGAHKDWAGWNKYWVDYKAKLKKRVAAVRASHVRTGGGPSTDKPLAEIEEKFLLILGDDFGQGTPGVRVEPPPEIVTAAIDVGVQDSPVSESILHSIQSILNPSLLTPIQDIPVEPILEPLPQNPPLEPMVQNLPARSPSRTPTQSPRPATTSAARSPRRRRRRREPLMSQEAARRALVRSSQVHAEAAVRSANALERIVRILNVAFPTVAEQENSE